MKYKDSHLESHERSSLVAHATAPACLLLFLGGPWEALFALDFPLLSGLSESVSAENMSPLPEQVEVHGVRASKIKTLAHIVPSSGGSSDLCAALGSGGRSPLRSSFSLAMNELQISELLRSRTLFSEEGKACYPNLCLVISLRKQRL